MGSVIGRRVLRREDSRFLKGEGSFVENLLLPNALHVTFVRSPFAHARIVDVSAVRALPETQVLTSADLDLGTFQPPPFPGLEQRMGRPFVAGDVVRFAGEIVALVVTESRALGADAAELVVVDYESLPAVVDPREALEDEVVLFPEVGTNVCLRRAVEQPDEALFDGCDVVVSGRIVSQRLAPSPLEPRSSAAVVGDDGGLTVWLSTQTPHQDRDGLARILGLDATRVRVIGPDVGGGFGAKTLSVEDVLVAWLARKTGRLVRWTETRGENMVAMPHGRGAILDVTIGGGRDGVVQAYRLSILQDVGAYPGVGAFLPTLTGLMASGVYRIPSIEIEAMAVVTNTTPVGPFRGAGRPEATQAIERAVDLFAAEVGLDPAEMRRRNFIPADAFLRTGSFSHGQGHETTFAMIVADRLGLPVDAVRVVKGDTDEVPRGTGTFGSKSTQLGGVAADQAAGEVVERARRLAADLLEASVDDVVLDLDTGSFHVVGAPRPALSWAELAGRLDGDGRLEELHVERDFKAESPTFPFGAHVAVVEVDTETGAVQLVRHVAVDDAGRIVNPVVAEGQVHGGIATGIAQALYEEVVYDEDGNPLTASLVGYAFPSAAELPSFESVEMETPTPVNALGAKGIGESGTIGATPAVQNAVVDALAPFGVRHVDMPANGERVWRAVQDARHNPLARVT